MTDIQRNPSKLVDIVSAGQLVGGKKAAQVVKNLSHKFSITESQAATMLKKGATLKKSVDIEKCKQVAQVFAELGLKVAVKQTVANVPPPIKRTKTQPVKKASVKKASIKKRVDQENTAQENNDNDAQFGLDVAEINFNKGTLAYLKVIAPILSLVAPLLFFLTVGTILWLFAATLIAIVNVSFSSLMGFVYLTGLLILLVLQIGLLVLLYKTFFVCKSRPKGMIIDQEEAPELHSQVEKLCYDLSIPYPSKIFVHKDVEIDIEADGGLRSLYRGRYILSVGLPVAMHFNRRQFIGVLTHSLAYLAKSEMRRNFYLIQGFQQWLYIRSITKDQWDNELETLLRQDNQWAVYILLKFIHYAVIGSKIFYGFFLQLSIKTSRGVVERLNSIADRYEDYVVSTSDFNKIAQKFQLLLDGMDLVQNMNSKTAFHGRLFRNIPSAAHQLANKLQKEKPNLDAKRTIDSHKVIRHCLPYQKNRLDKINRLSSKGATDDRNNAGSFFIDLGAQCERVTEDFYISKIWDKEKLIRHEDKAFSEKKITKMLYATKEVFSLVSRIDRSRKALSDYMGGQFSLRFIEFDEPVEAVYLKMPHQKIIDWIRERLVGFRENNKELELFRREQYRKQLSHIYYSVGMRKKAKKLDKILAARIEIGREIKNIDEEIEGVVTRLHVIDRMFFQRTVLAVQKMQSEDLMTAQHLMSEIQEMGELESSIHNLHVSRVVIDKILNTNLTPSLKILQLQLKSQSKECANAILSLCKKSLDITVYDGEQEYSLRDVITREVGNVSSNIRLFPAPTIVELAVRVEEVIMYYYGFMIAQLAELCLKSEAENGIGPLKLLAKSK